MDEQQTNEQTNGEGQHQEDDAPSAQEGNTKRTEAAAELKQEIDTLEEELGTEADPLAARSMKKRALRRYLREQELKPYQAELIKMQQYLEESGSRMIILFEGRDAAGKGGTSRRGTRYMN